MAKGIATSPVVNQQDQMWMKICMWMTHNMKKMKTRGQFIETMFTLIQSFDFRIFPRFCRIDMKQCNAYGEKWFSVTSEAIRRWFSRVTQSRERERERVIGESLHERPKDRYWRWAVHPLIFFTLSYALNTGTWWQQSSRISPLPPRKSFSKLV